MSILDNIVRYKSNLEFSHDFKIFFNTSFYVTYVALSAALSKCLLQHDDRSMKANMTAYETKLYLISSAFCKQFFSASITPEN